MLHKSSVLVKLTIQQWDGFKKDKRVSARVDEEFNTAGEAGNYNKRLLDKSVLKPIQKLANKIRIEHARMTMPWCYDGVSLLPSKMYFEYTALMRDLTDKYNAAVDNLIQQYPVHKANQAKALGALFNPEDYPARDDLAHRFSISYRFFPVPQSDHFIVDLEAAEAAKMKEALKQELVDTQAAALQSLNERVLAVVEHLHERLSDPENIFRDSLLENVVQIVNVLPRLNVFDDPTLTQVCKDLQEKVLICDAQDLRTDLDTRKAVADNAFDIVTLLKGRAAASQPEHEPDEEPAMA